MKSTTGEIVVKELKGDGLRVNVDYNDLNLRVCGDGCRVTVARNCGKIRVVGDGCSLKVNCNDGQIEYKGDGGNILLGTGSSMESVSYVGDGGTISVKSGKVARKEKEEMKKSDKISARGVQKLGCSLSDSELETKLDNEANERKEAEETKRSFGQEKLYAHDSAKRREKNLRRSKTVVVTTRISSEQIPINVNNNKLIQNWFRNPPSVIRSFKLSAASESL